MADDTRHEWHPDPDYPKTTKCGEPVVGGMKMTDDPKLADCGGCKIGAPELKK